MPGDAGAVVLLSPAGQILAQSLSAGGLLGWRPDETVGRHLREMVHPEDAASVREMLDGSGDPGGVRRLRLRRSDGSWPGFEVAVSSLRGGMEGLALTLRAPAGAPQREPGREETITRSVLDAVPGAVVVVGEDGIVRLFNRVAERIFGYEAGEVVGRPLEILIPERFRRAYREGFARYLRTREPRMVGRGSFELLGRRKNGEEFPVSLSIGVADDGEETIFTGVIRDITGHEEAEARFRGAFENSSSGMAIVGLDNRYLRVNRALCEMLGYEEEEIVGRRSFEFTHPDDLEESRKRARRMLEEGGPERLLLEKRYVRKDGEVIWAISDAALVRGDGGEPLYFVTQFHDVTARKRMEEELRKNQLLLRETESRYRTLIEQIPAVTYIDRDQEVRSAANIAEYTSPQIEDLTGYTVEEWLDPNRDLWRERLHPEDRERVLAADDYSKRTGEPFSEEYRLIARDGSVVWVLDKAVRLEDDGVGGRLWQGILLDITDRKRAEEALRESEERFRAVVESMDEGLIITDADDVILYANPRLSELSGYEQEEILGRKAYELLLDPGHEKTMLQRNQRRMQGVSERYEIRMRRKDGSYLWVEVSAGPYRGSSGRIVGTLAVVKDMSERRKLEERLRYQAFHDPLTGLANRALFIDRLRRALSRSGSDGSRVAVLFMDLDDFKVINDSLGHDWGDRALELVAERLRSRLRPRDLIARLGGDEFAVLLEQADEEEAVGVARRIEEGFGTPIQLGGLRWPVRVSVGIATGVAGQEPLELLRQADMAMYRAKARGKAGHQVFGVEPDGGRPATRPGAGRDLRRALERGEFEVRYRPVVELKGGSIGGMQAILCWRSRERGLLGPEAFTSSAEESGLIVELGRWMLRESCRRVRGWAGTRRGDPIPLHICFPARFLRHPGLVRDGVEILREEGPGPGGLVIELSGSAAVREDPEGVEAVRRLRECGARVAVDSLDLGDAPEPFPAEQLVIGAARLEGLEEAGGFFSGVVRAAHAARLLVLADGVESAARLEGLREAGCDLARGGYFSGLLSAAEAEELLRSGPRW